METAQVPLNTPEHLLRDLERRGLQIAARSGKLVVRPSRAITPEARKLIRENKLGLLRLVRPKLLNAEEAFRIAETFPTSGYFCHGFTAGNPTQSRDLSWTPAKYRHPSTGTWVFCQGTRAGT